MKNIAETIINPFFVFNGCSSKDFGIVVLSMPEVYKAEKRIDTVKVAGRNGVLHIDDDSYEPVSKVCSCAIRDKKYVDEICAWLNGSGEVIFSTEPTKVYRAFVNNQISISQMMNVFQKFQVTFEAEPFKYNVNAEDDLIVINTENNIAEKSLYNIGTIYSEPIIKLSGNFSGSDNIVITINNKKYTIKNLSTETVINCETMEVYDENGNKNSDFIPADLSLFPCFEVGKNELNFLFSGTGEKKIEIVPQWRWL